MSNRRRSRPVVGRVSRRRPVAPALPSPRPAAGPPPPHLVAFHDQVDAAVRAGDLPEGQRWHLDVYDEPGTELADVHPRLCTAPDAVPCYGAC